MLAASATVAGVDSLPDEPLYGWKLAVEQGRLALAQTSEDRAGVELSMAEHRLKEAVALAARARHAEADAATSAFGAHVATAAAHLQESNSTAVPAVAEQLRDNLARQQAKFAEHLRRVAGTTRASSTAVEALSEVATSVGEGKAVAADRIAEAAARTAERAAESAAQRVKAEPPAPKPAPAPRAVTTRPASGEQSSGGAKLEAAARPGPGSASEADKQRAEQERAQGEGAEKERADKERVAKERAKAEEAAKAAKEAAKRARDAAERAKNAKKGQK